MSHYSESTLEITDQECLVQALEDVMPSWKGHIEVHATPQSLYGYQGDIRSQRANIIIRRQYVQGSANDIGFLKQADGSYKVFISDFDKGKYNDKWKNKLKYFYVKSKVKKEATKRGFFVKSDDERMQVVLTKNY